MPQQLAKIAVLRIRYPDPRKAVFDQEPQQQLRVLAIGLLFAYPLGADLGGVPDPQLELQARRASARTSARIRWLPWLHVLAGLAL